MKASRDWPLGEARQIDGRWFVMMEVVVLEEAHVTLTDGRRTFRVSGDHRMTLKIGQRYLAAKALEIQ